MRIDGLVLIDKPLGMTSNAALQKIKKDPLAKEYKKGFTEGPADLRNMGKTKADTIAGALFLEEFVGEDVKWLHLDTAETAWANEERNFTPVGGTGTTVRTLVRLFSSF